MLGQPEHEVQVLNRLTGGSFDKVIDRADDDDMLAVLRVADAALVRADDVDKLHVVRRWRERDERLVVIAREVDARPRVAQVDVTRRDDAALDRQ